MNSLKVLTCHCGGRRIGLDVVLILGIARPRRGARRPGAPPFVAGVVDMREQAVVVIDLAARLGLRDRARPPEGPVLLLESEEPVAVSVDFASDVVAIDPERLTRPAGALGAGLQGVAADGLLLLDAEALVDGRPLRPLPSVVPDGGDGYPEASQEGSSA